MFNECNIQYYYHYLVQSLLSFYVILINISLDYLVEKVFNRSLDQYNGLIRKFDKLVTSDAPSYL